MSPADSADRAVFVAAMAAGIREVHLFTLRPVKKNA